MTNRTKSIKFTTTKNGQKRAFYWAKYPVGRWLPISVAKAEYDLATGAAVMVGSTADPLPANYQHTSIEGDVWSVRS